MWRVAVLHHGSSSSAALHCLRQGLRVRGLVEGHTCVIDVAGAEGRLERLPGLMEGLLLRRPDVVAVLGAVAALVAQRATASIPIVHAIVLDPAGIGLRAGNVTGITTFDADHGPRQLRLLRELVPGLCTVALLADRDAPKGTADGANPLASRLIHAAGELRIGVKCVELHGADADIGAAFDTFAQARAEALVVLEVPAVMARVDDIGLHVERHRLPAVFPPGRAQAGVLMMGPALQDAIDPLAGYISAIASGARVAELPTRTVRHRRLIVHLGNARRIGLAIPDSILQRATHSMDDDGSTEPSSSNASPANR